MIFAQATLVFVWVWSALTFLRAMYGRMADRVWDLEGHATFFVQVGGVLALSSGLFALTLR